MSLLIMNENSFFGEISKKFNKYSCSIYFTDFNDKYNSIFNKHAEKTTKIIDFLFGIFQISKKVNKILDYSLQYGCKNGDLPIVLYLISNGANINSQDKNGDFVIHLATIGGLLNIVKYLIEKRNIPIDSQGNNERTPLHYACSNDHFEIVEYLLSIGANIEAKDKMGKTPLHYACEEGHLHIIEYLISMGANIEAKDNYGNSIIHIASEHGLLQIIQYLIEKQNIDKDSKGANQRTPLHYACLNNHLEIVEYLLSQKANLEAKDKNEKTPLHYACEGCFLPIAEFLISKGADIEATDKYKRTPLYLASQEGHLSIIEYLISKGANLEVKNINDWTPLHYASYYGKADVIKYLLSKGANKNSPTKEGKIPFDLAKNDEIKNILK